MIKKYFLLYLLAISISIFLGLLVWQSNRYYDLSKEVQRLEQSQGEWIESNKRLVADIAEKSSAERIEDIAKNQLQLRKIFPENYLQVRITGGKGHEY